MLGGEITVESKKNEGSKFTFTIPFVQKEEEQIPIVDNVIDCHHPKTKELNLLIVEDDEVSAELLKTIFQDEFKQIFHAISGMDAIDICKINENIDLVLMDIKLPIMNGFDTTREIRKFNKSIIIIGQTAYAMPDDENKALEAGCNEYITKPIIKDKLLGLINLYFNNNK